MNDDHYSVTFPVESVTEMSLEIEASEFLFILVSLIPGLP